MSVTSTSTSFANLESRANAILERLGSVPASSEAMTAFFQRRIVFMFGLASALWLATWGIDRVLCHFLGGQFWEHGEAVGDFMHVYLHLGVGLGLAFLACVVRRAKLGRLALSSIEVTVTIAQIVLFCVMLRRSPLDLRPDLAMLLASAHILVLRAALIPAGPRSAGTLGLISSVIVGVFSYELWRDAGPGMAWAGKVSIPIINTIIWSVVSIVGTSAVSFVIYGLRKRVQKAMELGQYTLLEKLGEGGMGVVYRAQHALLRRPTAIKLLRMPQAAEPCFFPGRGRLGARSAKEASPKPDEAALARFEREVQLTAQISHPNIVSVYDFGRSPEGAFFYAMEFLDGVDLQRLVEEHGPLPPARIVHILAQMAEALSEAHAVGLIHRDVKPANVIVCEHARRSDLVKVVDFGLVKELSGASPAVSDSRVVTGTPLYMAPEIITNPGDSDPRGDLYALGAVGYFLLTGEPVFEGKTVVEVCGAHLHKAVVPPSLRTNTKVPAELEALLLRCLAKSRQDRPSSAEEIQRMLRAMPVPVWGAEEARAWWADRKRGLLTRKAAPKSGMRALTVASRELADTTLAEGGVA
jgi:eukaryotic-like serine/threonine-protein kinase